MSLTIKHYDGERNFDGHESAPCEGSDEEAELSNIPRYVGLQGESPKPTGAKPPARACLKPTMSRVKVKLLIAAVANKMSEANLFAQAEMPTARVKRLAGVNPTEAKLLIAAVANKMSEANLFAQAEMPTARAFNLLK